MEAMPEDVRLAVDRFFAGHSLGLGAFEAVRAAVEGADGVEVRVTRSQVSFRRRIGFAWLWLPGRWLAHPGAEVVLSIGLSERLDSARWKEVVQPATGRWMHHLEIHAVEDLDDEVAGWLRRAADEAG